jgi:4-hydroxy-tetrahydrodipicolinate reductase
MTRIIIVGSKGRMGQALIACAANFRELEIVGQIDAGDDLSAIISKSDVVIDFSSHSATPGVVDLCAKNKKAVVIGTTGHSDSEKSQIANRKSQIANFMVSPALI